MRTKYEVKNKAQRSPSVVGQVTELILWVATLTFVLALLFPSPASAILWSIGITYTGVSAALTLAGLVAGTGFFGLFVAALCCFPDPRKEIDAETHIKSGVMKPLFKAGIENETHHDGVDLSMKSETGNNHQPVHCTIFNKESEKTGELVKNEEEGSELILKCH